MFLYQIEQTNLYELTILLLPNLEKLSINYCFFNFFLMTIFFQFFLYFIIVYIFQEKLMR